ncbi:MAG: hypothetical protein R3C05_16740 [Pirellulaceae bacterium]
MSRHVICLLLTGCLLAGCSLQASAQMIQAGVGQQNFGDSFFENIGPGGWTQSSSRSMSMSSASLTTLNGYPGSMFSGTVRPFVTGLTPSVGSFVPGNDEIRQFGLRQQQATLESIAQRKSEARNEKMSVHLQRALRAEQSGNLKMARANFRIALANADPITRQQIMARMAQHGWRP